MTKWLGIIFILSSFIFLGVGAYNLYMMNAKQNSVLKEAHSIVQAKEEQEKIPFRYVGDSPERYIIMAKSIN